MKNDDKFWKQYAINSKMVLDPVSRNLEVMFGIIMALSFTSTVSITHNGHAQIDHFLWAIIGCNLAWGIVDGLTFLISGFLDRVRKNHLLHAIRNAPTKELSISIAREELQPLVAAIIEPEQLNKLFDRLMTFPPPPKRIPFLSSETKDACIIFLINFFSTLPVAIPFIFLSDPVDAKLYSDMISLTILFICGYSTGKYSGIHPWLSGIAMILIGSCFLMITLVLGG